MLGLRLNHVKSLTRQAIDVRIAGSFKTREKDAHMIQINPAFKVMSCLRNPLHSWAAIATIAVGIAAMTSNNVAYAQDQTEEVLERTSDAGITAEFPTEKQVQDALDSEIDSGTMTTEQAAAILRIYQRLSMGLDSGRLSTSEALQIMETRSRAIYENGTTSKNTEVPDRRAYEEAAAKMNAMVEAGDITREDMQKRLEEMKRRMSKKRTMTQVEFDRAAAELNEMFKAGKITREQMEQRLERMKQMLPRERTITQKDYEEAEAKLAEMVKAGKITRKDMQIRLDEMKKIMAAQRTMTQLEYDRAAAELAELVKAGTITRQQMSQRLERMKQMLPQQRSMTRKDYQEAAAKMNRMVKKGEISREDMEKRLAEIRKMIAADSNSEQPPEDDCRALGMKLRAAVAAGEMSTEEARAAWEAACGDR